MMSKDSETAVDTFEDTFKVVDVLTPSRLVLNCGSDNGIKSGTRFWVYGIDTGENLERVILPRGYGKTVFVQKKICTIESIETKSTGVYALALGAQERAPFLQAQRGDLALKVVNRSAEAQSKS
jgi:hypothetical protein